MSIVFDEVSAEIEAPTSSRDERAGRDDERASRPVTEVDALRALERRTHRLERLRLRREAH